MRIVSVRPNSELDQLLESIRDEPVQLERAGFTYRLTKESEDLFAHHDVERARRALDRAFGSLKGVDVPALLKELRLEREQDSEGRPAQ